MLNYYFEYEEPNQDYDDIYKIYIYDNNTSELIGTISYEIVMEGSDYFEEEVENYFDSDSIIYIQEVKINRNYRYKGYGNILFTEFLLYCLNVIGNYNLILLPYCIDNNLGISNLEYKDILIKFYEKMGFSILENTNYMVQKLN